MAARGPRWNEIRTGRSPATPRVMALAAVCYACRDPGAEWSACRSPRPRAESFAPAAEMLEKAAPRRGDPGAVAGKAAVPAWDPAPRFAGDDDSGQASSNPRRHRLEISRSIGLTRTDTAGAEALELTGRPTRRSGCSPSFGPKVPSRSLRAAGVFRAAPGKRRDFRGRGTCWRAHHAAGAGEHEEIAIARIRLGLTAPRRRLRPQPGRETFSGRAASRKQDDARVCAEIGGGGRARTSRAERGDGGRAWRRGTRVAE